MPVVSDRSMQPAEWAMRSDLSILWGGSFFFTRVALRQVTPLTRVASRVALAALLLNVLVLAAGERMRGRHIGASFLLMGWLNNAVPFTLIVWGQTHTTSGLAAILNAAIPLSTVNVAHLFMPDETLTGSRLLGVLTGFTGVHS